MIINEYLKDIENGYAVVYFIDKIIFGSVKNSEITYTEELPNSKLLQFELFNEVKSVKGILDTETNEIKVFTLEDPAEYVKENYLLVGEVNEANTLIKGTKKIKLPFNVGKNKRVSIEVRKHISFYEDSYPYVSNSRLVKFVIGDGE